MPRRPSPRLPLFAAVLVAVLATGVVPLAVSVGVPGGVGPGADPAAAEAAPLRPGPAYWLAGSDGGVFAFGRARFAGAAADAALRSPVAGVASTPSGEGYWLAGRDGGVFAFGDAPFLGGASDLALNTPVVDVAATPSGRGYWLAGADGGVFAFGDARWLGGAAGAGLNSPVTAVVPTPSGRGYWLASGDGGVFAFGDARFSGSGLGMAANGSVVGIATTPAGRGYWLASSDGGVFAFGDAGFHGSAADAGVRGRVVGIASGVGRAVPVAAGHLMSTFGWDVSWPQCGRPLPAKAHGFAIIGVTDGHLWDINPCLAEQHRWSTRGGALGGLYVNVNWPSRADEPTLPLRMADACGPGDEACQLYQWGFRGVSHAVDEAARRSVSAPRWWLDVETANRWSQDTARNALIVRGAIDALTARGIDVGIYSTSYQWGVIVGDFAPGLPIWVAGPRDVEEAARACRTGPSFGGGVVWMVQYPHQGFDGNLMCDAGAAEALRSFVVPAPPPVPQLPAPAGPVTKATGPMRAA